MYLFKCFVFCFSNLDERKNGISKQVSNIIIINIILILLFEVLFHYTVTMTTYVGENHCGVVAETRNGSQDTSVPIQYLHFVVYPEVRCLTSQTFEFAYQ